MNIISGYNPPVMVNKDKLYTRLEEMLNLPSDWDGCGSEPIKSNVYAICKKIVEFIHPEVDSVKFFVGITTPGTASVEIIYLLKTFEFTITLDGTIFFDEYLADIHLGSGSFFISRKKLQEILSN